MVMEAISSGGDGLGDPRTRVLVMPEPRDSGSGTAIVVGAAAIGIGLLVAYKLGVFGQGNGNGQPCTSDAQCIALHGADYKCIGGTCIYSPGPLPPPPPPADVFNWSGYIVDVMVNPVPGVIIEMEDRGTGFVYGATTDGTGLFVFTGLPTGIYNFYANKVGYHELIRPNLAFTIAKTYDPLTFTIMQAQTMIDSVELTRDNASSGNSPDECQPNAQRIYWDIPELLRAKGHTVPEGKVNLAAASGIVYPGNGRYGFVFDLLWMSLYYDALRVANVKIKEAPGGKCSRAFETPRPITSTGKTDVTTVSMQSDWGTWKECNIQILADWKE